MIFLKSPIALVLLVAALWIACKINNATEAKYGVDSLEFPQLFGRAVIGTVIFCAVIVGLALLRGEKWESEAGESFAGKGKLALKIIVGAVVLGFIYNFVLNKDILFFTQGGAYASDAQRESWGGQVEREPVYSGRTMRVGDQRRQRAQQQTQYQPVRQDDGQGFR